MYSRWTILETASFSPQMARSSRMDGQLYVRCEGGKEQVGEGGGGGGEIVTETVLLIGGEGSLGIEGVALLNA